jgi:parallel beta-helix repeat protein
MAVIAQAGPPVNPKAPATQRFNVQDFGARGDGATDDTEAFQHALDACGGKKPCMVIVPAGRYLCRTLHISSHTRLQGQGDLPAGPPHESFSPKSVIILAPHVNADLLVNKEPATGNSDIQIRLLTLEGQSGLQRPKTNPCHGINFIHVAASLIEGCVIRDFEMDGIYLGAQGAGFGPSDNNVVRQCRLADNLRNGISITRGRGNIVEGCLVENNNKGAEQCPEVYGAGAIDVEPNAANDDCSDTIVRNCTVRENHFTGIQCVGPGRLSGLFIEKCDVESNAANGLTLIGRDGFLYAVRDCFISRNERLGLYIGGQISPSVTNNVIANNQWHGVLFDKGASDESFKDNRIEANAGDPIKYSSTAKPHTQRGPAE